VNPTDRQGADRLGVAFNEPICVVIGRTRHKMVQIEIQEAARQGACFMELRLDFLAKAPDFKRLLENKPAPMIATVRRPVDGGRWSGTEDQRQALLRQAIVSGFDWVDLETDIADKVRRFRTVRRIISYHNLQKVPDDLEAIHEQMCKQDADVVKLAVRAQSPADNLRVLKLLRFPAKPTVAFCMGDLGMPSRLLGASYGAPFTYAAFNKERGIAPGLPSYHEVKNIYHYPQIDPDTQVYGVIGDPVSHSLSPLIHNTAFRKMGINALYLPFRVPNGELQPFLSAFAALDVKGYSVTIPHKEEAARLGLADPTVLRTGAANTLVARPAGFSAYNTDYAAIHDALRDHLITVSQLEGQSIHAIDYDRPFASRTVLILGAGGVARAAAFALSDGGGLLTIASRTADRALQIAHEIGCRQVDWGARHNVLCDIVVNCTPVGMHPEVDVTPLHHSFLRPGLTVFDTVYTPENTLLVKEARARGCHVVTGVDLFVRQAARQFQLFTDQEPPLELFRKLVKRFLSPVTIKEEA
jgi:3-dehydroquinate dehydratase / shikimate dehydrogenase